MADGSWGTGFITHATDDLRGIATAAHVVDAAVDRKLPITVRYEQVTAVFGGGHGGILKRHILNQDSDAVLLLVKKAGELPHPTVRILGHDRLIGPGVELGWLGFPLIADRLCFFSGRVSSTEPDRNRYLIDGSAVNGVSGGPVFCVDDQIGPGPTIVGSISAYNFNMAQVETDDELHNVSLPGLAVANDVSAIIRSAIGTAGSDPVKALVR